MAENPNQEPNKNDSLNPQMSPTEPTHLSICRSPDSTKNDSLNPQMSPTEPTDVSICRSPDLTKENFSETRLSLDPESKVSDFVDDQVNNGTNMFHQVTDDSIGEILGSELELGFSDDDFETNPWLSTGEYDDWNSNVFVYYMGEFSGDEIFDEGWNVGLEISELGDDAYYIGEHDMMFEEYLLETGAYETPAAVSTVENLISSIITQENIENNHVTCAVCLEEFNVGETSKVLPCSHFFHEDCIFSWLEVHNTCPVCRHRLPSEDPE